MKKILDAEEYNRQIADLADAARRSAVAMTLAAQAVAGDDPAYETAWRRAGTSQKLRDCIFKLSAEAGRDVSHLIYEQANK